MYCVWVLCHRLLLLVLSVPYALVVFFGCGRQQLSRWSWHPLARALCVSEGCTDAVAHPRSAHVRVACAVRQSPLLASTARVTPLLRCSPAS